MVWMRVPSRSKKAVLRGTGRVTEGMMPFVAGSADVEEREEGEEDREGWT